MNRIIPGPPETAYGQKIEGKDLSYQEWAAGIVPQIREKMDWCCHKNQGKSLIRRIRPEIMLTVPPTDLTG